MKFDWLSFLGFFVVTAGIASIPFVFEPSSDLSLQKLQEIHNTLKEIPSHSETLDSINKSVSNLSKTTKSIDKSVSIDSNHTREISSKMDEIVKKSDSRIPTKSHLPVSIDFTKLESAITTHLKHQTTIVAQLKEIKNLLPNYSISEETLKEIAKSIELTVQQDISQSILNFPSLAITKEVEEGTITKLIEKSLEGQNWYYVCRRKRPETLQPFGVTITVTGGTVGADKTAKIIWRSSSGSSNPYTLKVNEEKIIGNYKVTLLDRLVNGKLSLLHITEK